MLQLLVYIEDDSTHRELFLEATSFNISLERSTDPGWLFIEFDKSPYDGVLLFLEEHETESLVACKSLRKHTMGSLVPIVMVGSEHSRIQNTEQAIGAGADQFCPASMSAKEILMTFGNLLNLAHDFEAEEQPPPLTAPEYLWLPGKEPDQSDQDRSFAEADSLGTPPSEQIEGAFEEQEERYGADGAPRRVPAAFIPKVTSELLKRKLRAVRHEDYFAILEVRKGATARELKDGVDRLRRQYDPNNIAAPLCDRYLLEIREILDTIEDAWAVLSDVKLKKQYLKSILILK